VQGVLNERWRWSPKDKAKMRQPKAFTKLLRCANCDSGITAEVQKGHTYYRCTRKNRARLCFQPFIREEDLNIEISSLLTPFALRADWADEMLELVKKEKKECAQSAELVASQKRTEIEKVSQRLQRLVDSLLDGLIDRETFTVEKAKLMSQKKTLEEQIKALSGNPKVWLEPFQNWVISARNAGETAVSGTLQEKRVLAQQVFGSNLVLDCKKARGSCVKPRSLLVENSSSGGLVGTAGFEPATVSV
jgi:site-specific DNA recombinase